MEEITEFVASLYEQRHIIAEFVGTIVGAILAVLVAVRALVGTLLRAALALEAWAITTQARWDDDPAHRIVVWLEVAASWLARCARGIRWFARRFVAPLAPLAFVGILGDDK